MKKILLTLGFAAATLAASAQTTTTSNSLLFYSGDATVDYLGASWYSFDGLKNGDNSYDGTEWIVSTAVAPKDTVIGDNTWLVTGGPGKPSGYYVGGIGNQHYVGTSALPISEGWDGDFSTAVLTFDVQKLTAETNLEVKFLVDETTSWGIKVPASAYTSGKVSLKLSDFAVNGGAASGWNYDGDPMTNANFLAVTKLHIQVGLATETGYGKVLIDNLRLRDAAAIAGIVEDFIANNSNVEVSAFDMMGKVVATGKSADVVAGLENGKVYVLRAGNNVIKIVK